MNHSYSRFLGSFFISLCLFWGTVTAQAATLMPPGKQVFVDVNGKPLASGTVTMYIPGTTTLKNTWQDSNQTILNTNPIALDLSGQAIIYGAGCYRQIVKDSDGNTIWDQPTCDTASTTLIWGGNSGGTANAQTVTAPNFTGLNGQTIAFVAGATNTSALGLVVNGGTSINVKRDLPSGPVSLAGGEVVTGNLIMVTYDVLGGAFHLVNNPVVGSNALSTLSGSGTTDLGLATSRYVNITGTASISSFGSSASLSFPLYTLTFAGISTLVNSSNMLLPGGANITTAAGDYALAAYKGSGIWQILDYTKAAVSLISTAPAITLVGSCPYATPTDANGRVASRLDVEIWGGGGGGAGGAGGGNGGIGGTTTFNSITAVGGSGGLAPVGGVTAEGGSGGTGGSGSSAIRVNGGAGSSSVVTLGGLGGRSAFPLSVPGMSSLANTTSKTNGLLGGGGAGNATGTSSPGGGGGGGGEYASFSISSPASSIACTIGNGGSNGSGAGSGGIGSALVKAYWQ